MAARSIDSLMTAIVQDRYGSADVLQLREIERPRPRADEVIIRVHAAGVEFGVWHLMEGLPYAVRLASGLRRPRASHRIAIEACAVGRTDLHVVDGELRDPVLARGVQQFL